METIEKTRSFPNRLICYFVGLFIMTAGIAISVKSNLGFRRSARFRIPLHVAGGWKWAKQRFYFTAFWF